MFLKRMSIMFFCLCLLFLNKLTNVKSSESSRVSICLNGEWEISGVGSEDKIPDFWDKVRVPSDFSPVGMFQTFKILESWQKNTSFWYRLKFPVPEDWRTRKIKLRFEAVNFSARVLVNGKFCGEHQGAFFPFEIDITDAVKPGEENTLLVFVQSPLKFAKGKYPDGTPLLDYALGESWRYIGIDGDVYLAAYPEVYVKELFIMPSVRKKKLTVRAEITNEGSTSHGIIFKNKILKNGQTKLVFPEKLLTLAPGETKEIEVSKGWNDPVLWGIGGEYGEPYLYFLSSSLSENGRAVDEKFSRFGFREFYVEGTDFYLNGKKIYLQGDTYMGGSQCRDFWTRYYRMQRSANITIIRAPHMGIMSPVYLDIADEVGMLIKPEFPVGGREYRFDDPVHMKAVKNEYKEWIKRDRNHPSVVMWSADNEVVTQIWESLTKAEKMVEIDRWVKELDPTRPVDNEGDYTLRADLRTDVASIHGPEYSWIENWQMKYKKPLVLGELYSSEAYNVWFAKDRTREKMSWAYRKASEEGANQIRLYRKLNVPYITAVWAGQMWFYFDLEHTGPWQTRWNVEKDWGREVVEPTWPALSGPGYKMERMETGGLTGYVNWFDPRYPEHITTEVYHAIKEAFREMSALKETTFPEAIIKAGKENSPLIGVYVFIKPLENQATSTIGVMTDREGKSWFLLPEKGRYEVGCLDHPERMEIEVQERKIDKIPGYNIPVMEMDLQ